MNVIKEQELNLAVYIYMTVLFSMEVANSFLLPPITDLVLPVAYSKCKPVH